uniref:CSON000491 protein n=1 Tax=Culicoides sonorensis TaxID=179676 RepID=A0A336KWA0_CULSO
MRLLGVKYNGTHVKALLRKDYLVRRRQPWMTLVQYLWPCVIFLALYILRNRFKAYTVDECQFPTRQLPSSNNLLPFFQSYICSIENKCLSVNEYHEVPNYEDAPVTPVLNIVQTFLNEEKLYNAIINLPIEKNFIGTVISVVTHPQFKYIENNSLRLGKLLPEVEKIVGANFDPDSLFSDTSTFSNFGKILCHHPFPRGDSIRIVNNILNSEDFNGADKREIDALPTEYCKQLYMDITNSNYGKITWSHIKPIIQGKILYGPDNNQTREIIQNANQTFSDMARLKKFLKSIDNTFDLLKSDEEFKEKYNQLIRLAKSPLIKQLAGDSFNPEGVEQTLNGILNDKRISNTVRVISNLFDCYSVDRFIPVSSETALEDKAFELSDDKLLYAGIYFTEDAKTNETAYKLRMNIDDTPVTSEVRNRFWFPGPEGNMALDLRYHRGFAQIQQSVDMAIIKVEKNKKKVEHGDAIDEVFAGWDKEHASSTQGPFPNVNFDNDEDDGFDDFESDSSDGDKDLKVSVGINNPFAKNENDDGFGSFEDDSDEVTEVPQTTAATQATDNVSTLPEITTTLAPDIENPTTLTTNPISSSESVTSTTEKGTSTTLEDSFEFYEEDVVGVKSKNQTGRRKRQLGSLLDRFFANNRKNKTIDLDDMKYYTKQFPYPKYQADDFKKGLYLAQAVQMSFFFALIVQIASSVRQRIWIKESGNITLMRTMGLVKSAEIISWIITTIFELTIIMILVLIVLYTGGILVTSSKLFMFTFLMAFSCCVVSFCFMCSTFFSSASIGTVSSVIFFLITFMPYIIIISLGATLQIGGKIAASLSASTAFCYAWRFIMRTELQQKELGFSNAFEGNIEDNDFKFGFVMIIIDTIIYTLIGTICEKFFYDDNNFYEVSRKQIDKNHGAELINVTKIYEGTTKKAVDNVSLVLKRDHVTALLGRNGAGKSTIIKMLTGQLQASEGDIFLPLNYDLITGNKNNQEKIGLCAQNNILIPNLTAKEHLELYAKIKMRSGFNSEIKRVLSNLKFGKYRNYSSQELSGGYKRRLCIAIAFIASPNLVILDEPCTGVDTKARKNIWSLIESLRKGRAVALATHFLDEAEQLSDKIVIVNQGKIVSENTMDTLKNEFTKSFELSVQFQGMNERDKTLICDNIRNTIKEVVPSAHVSNSTSSSYNLNIPYKNEKNEYYDFEPFIKSLEKLQNQKKIHSFNITTTNLSDIFKKYSENEMNGNHEINGNSDNTMHEIPIKDMEDEVEISTKTIVTSLFWKRLTHFIRNYRMLLCILVLPVVFECIAMIFLIIRPPGEYDTALELGKGLYPGSTEFYSNEASHDPNDTVSKYSEKIYDDLMQHCEGSCELFNSSKETFNWILRTSDDYIERRYGGISVNHSNLAIWYNNKGYHSMASYINVLNNAVLRKELNETSFKIRTINHPFKLNDDGLSFSSVLTQVADAGVSLIILIAFSLVLAGASVYIVSERISGEKLQQKLCGVSFHTYWGVTFLWDFILYGLAVIAAVIVFLIFNLPLYVDRDQLPGIVLLLFLYGFATIPLVHIVEKLFSDASFANMTIFCMNVIIALATLTIIILMDVLMETDEDEEIRNVLNRVFLIFPQHALADGLLEICKNYIQSKLFERYFINTYKSPVASDLLLPHFAALITVGIICIIINYIIESKMLEKFFTKTESKEMHESDSSSLATELEFISIQNTMKRLDTYDMARQNCALNVVNVYKKYHGHDDYAVKNVSFHVKDGECFGLLGANGAGKSTLFGILSGQILQTSGYVKVRSEKGISYCPQTNALDPLLTVEEVIRFYGRLRKIRDLNELTEKTLTSLHLTQYKNVLVKNLSGGNRRKLSVAVTCFGNTNIVLMDEPTSDMDPITRSLVYKIIKELIKNNRAVILTSHSISEIENICHRIAVLKDGKILSHGTPRYLKENFGNSYDIPSEFPTATDVIKQSHSTQFVVKIKLNDDEIENGDIINMQHRDPDSKILLSELFAKLNNLKNSYNILYTVSECLLDRIFESILESGSLQKGHFNQAYNHTSETPT